MNSAPRLGPKFRALLEDALAMLAWWCLRIAALIWVAGVMYMLWLLYREDD